MAKEIRWLGFVYCEITTEMSKAIDDSDGSTSSELTEWIDAMVVEGYRYSIKPLEGDEGYQASLYGVLAEHKHAGMMLTAEGETFGLACVVLWVKFLSLNGTWHLVTKSNRTRRYR